MNSQYAMRQARGRRAPRYKTVNHAGLAKCDKPGKKPCNNKNKTGKSCGKSDRQANEINEMKLSPKARRYVGKIVRHANVVRAGSPQLGRSDAAYLLGVIDTDVGILRSKGVFNGQREAEQVRDAVLREVLRNPYVVTTGPQRVRLHAHTTRAYRDF